MKAERKFPISQGGLDLRLLKYQVLPPKVPVVEMEEEEVP